MDLSQDTLSPDNVYPEDDTTQGTPLSADTSKHDRPKNVFISYSSLDRSHAFQLKRLLEENGVKVWLDVFDIRTAGKIDSDLFEIIGKQDMFCLLLSPKAVQSRWVQKEIETAKENPHLQILPIILRYCDIPADLQGIVGFDAREGLEHESVRNRLLKVILGDYSVEGPVLLSERERELQNKKFLQGQAEEAFPQIMEGVNEVSTTPMRKVHLRIYPTTLPEDPDIILELRLALNDPFQGAMSFFIARYREGHTWPDGYDFIEPSYDEFYLTVRPRLDVQFKWFDRVARLQSIIYGNTWKDHEETFTLEFDGAEFRPRTPLALPQVFEVPSLRNLINDNSSFELIAHNTSAQVSRTVSEGTDIAIELFGEVEKGQWLHLYRSHTTGDQRNLLNSPYLSDPGIGPILRETLLARFLAISGATNKENYTALEESLTTSIEKNQYSSLDERRLAGWYLFDRGSLSFNRHRWRDAYKDFEAAKVALRPLVMSQVPLMRDAVSLYLSVERMTRIWLRQKSFQNAKFVSAELVEVARSVAQSNIAEPDFQRILSDALVQEAEVNAELGRRDLALKSLAESVEILHQLYLALKLQSRQVTWLNALSHAIKAAVTWDLSEEQQVEEWRAKLRDMLGDNDNAFRALTIPDILPRELPIWLRECTLEMWPTEPINSAALRYSMKLPRRWSKDFAVRGTSHMLEHVYNGGGFSDAEWLVIGFMENADEHGDMKSLVRTNMMFTGLPVLFDLKVQPKLMPGTWQEMGTIPSLVKKLNADEAYAFMGVARFEASQASPAILGRLYVILVRKGTYVWRIVLSFETASLPLHMSEEMINSNDHVRAGAILGNLQLSGPEKAKVLQQRSDATPQAWKQSLTLHPVIEPDNYFGNLERLQTELAETLCIPALADSIHREGSYYTIEATSPATIEATMSQIDELMSKIIRGFIILREAGYCQEDFTLVILLPHASTIVRLTPVSFHYLQQLSGLVSLALGDVKSKKRIVQEYSTILDIGEAAWQIFSFFGFKFPRPNGPDTSVHIFAGLLQMLSLGLVSYAGSHTSNPIKKYISDDCSVFRIRISYSESPIFIFFHPVTLACLDRYVGGPVWSFSQTNPDSMGDSRKTVLTSIRSFVDLWGPARIVYSDPERRKVSKIQTERGTIGRRTSNPKLGGAVDCHWVSWEEPLPAQFECFDEGSLLAIGADIGHETHFDVRPDSVCSTRRKATGPVLENTSQGTDLGVVPDSWALDGINIAIGVSRFFVGNLLGMVKKFPGRSRKGLLLLEWAGENPDPRTLDIRIGLEISMCTGNALRLPLWELLRLDSVKDYVRLVLPNYLPKATTPSFLNAFDQGFDAFLGLWAQNEEFRNSIVVIVRKILRSLAFTGLKNGGLSAWFIDRPGGLLIHSCYQHNWLKLLADSGDEACLAVISRRCLQCACPDVVKCGDTSMRLHTALWTKIDLEAQKFEGKDLHSRNHEAQKRNTWHGSELPRHSDDDLKQSALVSAALSTLVTRHEPTDSSSSIGFTADPTASAAIPDSTMDQVETPVISPTTSIISLNEVTATTLDEDAGSANTIAATVYPWGGQKWIIMPRICNESTDQVHAVKLNESVLGWLTEGFRANKYSYRENTGLESTDSQSFQVCFR